MRGGKAVQNVGPNFDDVSLKLTLALIEAGKINGWQEAAATYAGLRHATQ